MNTAVTASSNPVLSFLLALLLVGSHVAYGEQDSRESALPESTPQGVQESQAEEITASPQEVPIEISEDTHEVTCFDDQWDLKGSRVVRTPFLVSRDRQHRAYVQVEAIVKKQEEVPVRCSNTSRLYVASPGESEFRLVFRLEPRRHLQGNGIRLVDWSPDSRLLLVDMHQWQYASDSIGNSPLIYDVEADKLTSLSQSWALSTFFGRECWLASSWTVVH
jgi:hypothetical protein